MERRGEETSQSSQDWLVGVDNSLDNFFRSGFSRSSNGLRGGRPQDATAASGSGVKRKTGLAGLSRKEGTSAKKAKTSGSKDGSLKETAVHKASNIIVDSSLTKSKGKNRQVLRDLTSTLQNSPRRQRRPIVSAIGSPKRRKSVSRHSTSPKSKNKVGTSGTTETNLRVVVLEDSSSSEDELEESDAPSRLCSPTFGKTPRRPSKGITNRLKGNLPTPPSSSIPSSRVQDTTDRSSSPTSASALLKKRNNAKKVVMQTPFTFSSTVARQNYPTPTSMAIPRLKFVPRNHSARKAEALFIPPPEPHLDSDSPLTSLSSSQGSSQTESQIEEKKPESPLKMSKPAKEDKSKLYTVIPSSQTQYIHYSPTKKRHTNDFPVFQLKQPSLTVIPSSQPLSSSPASSETITLSPRKTRKPTPIVTPGLAFPTSREEGKEMPAQGAVLNFVVPTSQEDEVEISLLDDATARVSQLVKVNTSVSNAAAVARDNTSDSKKGHEDAEHNPGQKRNDSCLQSQDGTRSEDKKQLEKKTVQSQSTQMRFINAMLDDLDRLAEETGANIVTVSQVLSRPPVPVSSPGILRRRGSEERSVTGVSVRRTSGPTDSQELDRKPSDNVRNPLFMQSSVTEPDASQWDEDPFSPTNEAYARHLGLPQASRASGPPTTCTQSSATQPDSDDEDPFPTLPPASTAESTADRAAVNRLLLTPQDQRKDSHQDHGLSLRGKLNQVEESQTESETQPDSEDGSPPMPNIASLDDTFDTSLLTPRNVRRAISSARGTSRFRRRDDSSFTLPPGSREDVSQEGEDEDESMPSAVRDFLGMFSQTQESEVGR